MSAVKKQCLTTPSTPTSQSPGCLMSMSMATSLAAQLSQIAAKSKTTLNLKAQRSVHSKSLLFEPRVAAAQTYQAIFTVCCDGYEELCHLDGRFNEYRATLFSQASQDEDRTLMTPAENERLDRVIESFLHLVGSRLRLLPAIKSIEWLVRRFRIHEFNTVRLLTTFLPYHTIPAFMTLLSILPRKLPQDFMFLDPYIRSLTAPPRAAIIHATISKPQLLSTISQYTLESCRAKKDYPALIIFWGGVMMETVNGLLDRTRSGRMSVQRENDRVLASQILPALNEALIMKDIPEIQIASYMIITVFAAKGGLEDTLLNAFMEQIGQTWTADIVGPALVCLSILAQHRSAKQLPSRVARSLVKVPDLAQRLRKIGHDHRVDKLANGLALALVDRLEKKGDVRTLPMVKSILEEQLLHEKQVKVIFKALLLAAHRVDDRVDPKGVIRKELGSTLIALSRLDGEVGEAVRKSIDEVDFNIEELELKLGAKIGVKPTNEQPKEDVHMQTHGTEGVVNSENIDSALVRLSTHSAPSGSCMASRSSNIFDELCALFLTASASETEMSKFEKSPLLSRAQAPKEPFYLTFHMHIWCGPYPSLARVAALEQVKDRLKEADCATVDFQAIIPYVLVALSDLSARVRMAAADLIAVLSIVSRGITSTKPARWGAGNLYADNNDLNWLEMNAARALLISIIAPSLEESVLHEGHILSALGVALNKTSDEHDNDKKKRIPKSTRLAIMKFLASHTISTPLTTVKLFLLRVLNQVPKVSSTTRTELLLPVLEWWATSVSRLEAQQYAAAEGLDEAMLDDACSEIIVANDKKGIDYLFKLVNTPEIASRPHFLHCLFARLHKLWPAMRRDNQYAAAQSLLDLCQLSAPTETLKKIVSVEAAEVLQSVDLSTELLMSFLDSARVGNHVVLKGLTRPLKGLREENGEAELLQAVADSDAAMNKLTFVLELVQESNPAKHPALFQSLFLILSDLHQLRSLVGSELGYLQNLTLSSLLAMMPSLQTSGILSSEASVSHGDILAACIQKSTSPAVINSALLIVASMARTAPDVVLHSVMPILTFMGSSVLRQADDYSAHVVNQTIKEVIPPLIDTFRKKRRNLVASTAELLSSFVVAYEHIPPHRKHDTFVLLIQNLGPEDFLFALLAMFVDKYGITDNGLSFLKLVMASFSVEIQLQALKQLLDLIGDIFEPKPSLSAVLLGKHEMDEVDAQKLAQKIALKELTLVPHLLANRRLKKEVAELSEKDESMEAAKIRELYALLLERLLNLADTVKTNKVLHTRCGEALSCLLNLLSTSEFIKSVETLLDRPHIALRQKVLRALESRVDRENVSSVESRVALLGFLPQLTAVIRDSDDIKCKQTAVMCVDKIAERYGKKDVDAVAAAAATIAGDRCLGHTFHRLRIMALLSLASLADVLQDAMVPNLPLAMPKALEYLRESMKGETPDVELHNATFAFLAALTQHLPYMVSRTYLDQILECCYVSAAAGLGGEAQSHRVQCTQFLATLVESETMFNALAKSWDRAANAGLPAVTEYLQLVGLAVEKHPKSVITKNITPLSDISMSILDLRRRNHVKNQSHERVPNEVNQVQDAVNEVILKVIYKLNDAVFRPIFSQLMEWCASGLPKQDSVGWRLRQESVFAFLASFFGTLKSIVTSYATYVIDTAVEALRSSDPAQTDERELWSRVLRTLAHCFEHDQDGFWQAPAHYSAVLPLLVEQFGRATGAASAQAEMVLVPAVVELATAADGKEHHKELNASLLKLLRSETAATRLLVVRCQRALADRLGEEWLQNLPEMLPYISELQDDDDEEVERENRRWIVGVEEILGESLDSMLQ